MAIKHFDRDRNLQLIAQAQAQGVLILGAGVTGQEAARSFLAAGCIVYLVDQAEEVRLDKELEAYPDINLLTGFKSTVDELLKFLDSKQPAFAVSSPGIPPKSSLLVAIVELGIPLVSELDLAATICGMPDVAVTGTNGKTTVVTLIDEMCRRSGVRSAVAGNVGAPLIGFCDIADHCAKESIKLICEVSSYQLAHAAHFAPHIAIVLNVADDHLGWHGGFDSYLESKRKLLVAQPASGWSLLWKDDPYWERLSVGLRAQLLPFGVKNERSTSEQGCWALPSEKKIVLNYESEPIQLSTAATAFVGRHNLINLAAAAGAAYLAGATSKGIQDAVDHVVPLPHRMESVVEIDGVRFVNDSKATNVSAVCAALESLKEGMVDGRVVLMLGGLSKEGSWTPLEPLIDEVCRYVVAFGADRQKIVEGLRAVDIVSVEDLEAAFHCARSQAQSGDIVLLSPGCASFDAFANYGARGEYFKGLCCDLAKTATPLQ